jgi:hypothetical protein
MIFFARGCIIIFPPENFVVETLDSLLSAHVRGDLKAGPVVDIELRVA